MNYEEKDTTIVIPEVTEEEILPTLDADEAVLEEEHGDELQTEYEVEE